MGGKNIVWDDVHRCLISEMFASNTQPPNNVKLHDPTLSNKNVYGTFFPLTFVDVCIIFFSCRLKIKYTMSQHCQVCPNEWILMWIYSNWTSAKNIAVCTQNRSGKMKWLYRNHPMPPWIDRYKYRYRCVIYIHIEWQWVHWHGHREFSLQ